MSAEHVAESFGMFFAPCFLSSQCCRVTSAVADSSIAANHADSALAMPWSEEREETSD